MNVHSQGKISVSLKSVKKCPGEKPREVACLQLNWHSTRTLCSKKKNTLLEVDSDSVGQGSCKKLFQDVLSDFDFAETLNWRVT